MLECFDRIRKNQTAPKPAVAKPGELPHPQRGQPLRAFKGFEIAEYIMGGIGVLGINSDSTTFRLIPAEPGFFRLTFRVRRAPRHDRIRAVGKSRRQCPRPDNLAKRYRRLNRSPFGAFLSVFFRFVNGHRNLATIGPNSKTVVNYERFLG